MTLFKPLPGVLVMIILSLGQLSGQAKASTAVAKQDSVKPVTAAVTQQLLVKQLEAGAKLDDPLPESITNDLKHVDKYDATNVATDRKKQPTYSDALNWVAKVRANEIIKIRIEATPKQCTVTYSAVTDQAHWFDLGLTTVDRPLRPNYYVLRCGCTVPVPEQKVDCTMDCSTRFSCGDRSKHP
jgi:hypothetical protein